MLKLLKHIGVVILLVFLFVGIPVLSHVNNIKSLNTVDAKAGSSIIVEADSSDYVILLNNEVHSEYLTNRLIKVFDGTDRISSVFGKTGEVSCLVCNGDSKGITMAKFFQSVLPEGLMKMRSDDAIMVISKAEVGLIDVVVMSKAYAENFNLSTEIDNVTYIEIHEENEEVTTTSGEE